MTEGRSNSPNYASPAEESDDPYSVFPGYVSLPPARRLPPTPPARRGPAVAICGVGLVVVCAFAGLILFLVGMSGDGCNTPSCDDAINRAAYLGMAAIVLAGITLLVVLASTQPRQRWAVTGLGLATLLVVAATVYGFYVVDTAPR